MKSILKFASIGALVLGLMFASTVSSQAAGIIRGGRFWHQRVVPAPIVVASPIVTVPAPVVIAPVVTVPAPVVRVYGRHFYRGRVFVR
jgi:hypothetical protein